MSATSTNFNMQQQNLFVLNELQFIVNYHKFDLTLHITSSDFARFMNTFHCAVCHTECQDILTWKKIMTRDPETGEEIDIGDDQWLEFTWIELALNGLSKQSTARSARIIPGINHALPRQPIWREYFATSNLIESIKLCSSCQSQCLFDIGNYRRKCLVPNCCHPDCDAGDLVPGYYCVDSSIHPIERDDDFAVFDVQKARDIGDALMRHGYFWNSFNQRFLGTKRSTRPGIEQLVVAADMDHNSQPLEDQDEGTQSPLPKRRRQN